MILSDGEKEFKALVVEHSSFTNVFVVGHVNWWPKIQVLFGKRFFLKKLQVVG